MTPYSFEVASPSQILAHVPFGLGIVRGWDVDWIDVSQNGEWVIYTSGDDFFGSNPTRDFNNVYFYRSNGASASGSTGIVPGGIGTETDTDVTSLDRVTIALLFLALGAAMLRATRPRVPIRKRTER